MMFLGFLCELTVSSHKYIYHSTPDSLPHPKKSFLHTPVSHRKKNSLGDIIGLTGCYQLFQNSQIFLPTADLGLQGNFFKKRCDLAKRSTPFDRELKIIQESIVRKCSLHSLPNLLLFFSPSSSSPWANINFFQFFLNVFNVTASTIVSTTCFFVV